MISETLLLAVGFNIILLLIGYFSGYRAVMIVSSIVWAIIGLMIYDEIDSILILGIIIMIAIAQIFIPLKGESIIRR